MKTLYWSGVVCLASVGALVSGGNRLWGAPPPSRETEAVLGESDVTALKLRALCQAALIKCEIDSDGDLKIEDDGMKSFVRVDTDKKLLSFFSIWPLRKSVTELEKLQLLNTLNKDLILVRFYMHDATTLVCDYQLPYDNGILPFQVVNAYRRFAKVTRGAILTRDPKDIISREKDE
jgi:hypothetical protein